MRWSLWRGRPLFGACRTMQQSRGPNGTRPIESSEVKIKSSDIEEDDDDDDDDGDEKEEGEEDGGGEEDGEGKLILALLPSAPLSIPSSFRVRGKNGLASSCVAP